MRLSHKPTLMGGGILNDIGHGFAEAARGIASIGSKIRGDQEDTYVQGEAKASMTNMLVYGGLAALGLYLVVKK